MILDWIGYQLVMRGPWQIVCNADCAFGRWCLRRGSELGYGEDVR